MMNFMEKYYQVHLKKKNISCILRIILRKEKNGINTLLISILYLIYGGTNEI